MGFSQYTLQLLGKSIMQNAREQHRLEGLSEHFGDG